MNNVTCRCCKNRSRCCKITCFIYILQVFYLWFIMFHAIWNKYCGIFFSHHWWMDNKIFSHAFDVANADFWCCICYIPILQKLFLYVVWTIRWEIFSSNIKTLAVPKHIYRDTVNAQTITRGWSVQSLHQACLPLCSFRTEPLQTSFTSRVFFSRLLIFLSAITRNEVVNLVPGNGARNACVVCLNIYRKIRKRTDIPL